ncbi:MAG TPA: MurT ligase domain-containing protein [Solirubrobacteraceae bacterium]|nr:MurT ligase domain-containing protein [Solirubrobacteraceae bacterium]
MTGLDVKIAAARAVGSVVRRSGRGGGTSLPGRVLIRLEPDAISELSRRLAQGTALISATNGKTTSAAMTASILGRAGICLVHNRAGANMAGGIASTLLDSARRGGRMSGDLGLFEVDEFWLDQMTDELRPRAIVLGNLFRDQLDRYGELETIADRWSAVVAGLPPQTALVLNADDPLVADLGRSRAGVSYFGVEDSSVAVPEMQHASDSKHCRRCGAAYIYDVIYMGHLGHYHCPSCGQTRPEPGVRAEQITLEGTTSARFTLRTPAGDCQVKLPLPGLYNVYNALAAAGLCLALGASLEDVRSGLEAVIAAFGRAETITVNGNPLSILLIKNPAGANEIIRTLALEPEPLQILAILNDQVADGRDVSWVWDADFELLSDHVEGLICSGSRAAELALRFKYGGVPRERIRVIPDLAGALDAALQAAAGRRLFALPTYTALLALRDELSRRGHVPHYWALEAAR